MTKPSMMRAGHWPTKWAVNLATRCDFFKKFADVFKHPKFKEMNAHLTDVEYHELVDPVLQDPSHMHHPKWPAHKPVKPAHKPSTCHYVQLKVGGRNVSVNTMIAAYKYKFCSPFGHTPQEGRKWLAQRLSHGWQASHLMGGYVGCQLDMNPNNIVVEPVWQNHARKGCALDWALGQLVQAKRRVGKMKRSPKLELEDPNVMEVFEKARGAAMSNATKRQSMSGHCHKHSATKDMPASKENLCKSWDFHQWGPMPPLFLQHVAHEMELVRKRGQAKVDSMMRVLDMIEAAEDCDDGKVEVGQEEEEHHQQEGVMLVGPRRRSERETTKKRRMV
jgi:hypothetical protein